MVRGETMILVTLGTQKEQFTRLLDYIENSNIQDEIIVQAGHTKYESKKMKIFDFIPYEKMNEYIEKADLIITHSGTGSVLMPLKKGKKVIACARLSKYEEHVDDHQKQLVDVFKQEGYILELDENNSLDKLIKQIKKFKPKKYKTNTKEFIKKLEEEIDISKTKKEKKTIFKNVIFLNTVLIFLTFLFISFFVPLTGDDWTNALFKTNNIFDAIKIAYDKYFIHEGRFMSRVFVIIFTNTKWLWNIFNAIMIATVYNISMKLIKPKNINLCSLIFAFSMLFIETTMFTQSYLWVTGNITYFLPMFLYIVYIFLVKKVYDNDFNFTKGTFIISITLNLLIPTMVEHISISLVCSNILLLLYVYVKTKKINKLFLINSIISIIGFLIIYLSPGALLRAKEMDFYSYSLFEKIFVNIPNFVNFTYVSNTMFLTLIVMLLILFINRHVKGIKKILFILIITILPILNIMANILTLISIYSSKASKILNLISFTTNYSNVYIIIFWCFITLMLFIINILYTKKHKNYKALFFFITGFLANFAMLLSPIWGGRTALFTLIMLSINILILIDSYSLKQIKKINKLLFVILIFYIIVLLILYNSVYRQQIVRENSIKEQIQNNETLIIIERFPENILWNSNAWNEIHEKSFKSYYDIGKEVEIYRKKIIYKKLIFY